MVSLETKWGSERQSKRKSTRNTLLKSKLLPELQSLGTTIKRKALHGTAIIVALFFNMFLQCTNTGHQTNSVSLVMSDYPAGQPSLVLVPPVALMQWVSEIESYTDGTLKTLVFHGTNPQAKAKTLKDLKKYDVIIMSYNSLESIYRKQEKGHKKKEGTYKEKSLIHALKFHRVILDEAHCIKTRTTMTAKACFALNAQYRWCLTGTPLQNRIGEFFSLIRFLNVDPFASYCK